MIVEIRNHALSRNGEAVTHWIKVKNPRYSQAEDREELFAEIRT